MTKRMLTGLVLLLAMPAMAQTSAEALAQQKELLTLQRDIATLKGELADQKFGFLKEIQLPKSEMKMGDGAMEAVVLAGGAARLMAGNVKTGVAGAAPILLLAPGERLALDLGALMEGRIDFTRKTLEKALKDQCLLSDPRNDELDPAKLLGKYGPKIALAETKSLATAGAIISGVSSLLAQAFSVEVNIKDVPISTDEGFLWAEVAKALNVSLGDKLITPSLALNLPPAAGGTLHVSVFGEQSDSLSSLHGKTSTCLGMLNSIKTDDAKAAAAKVKAVTDATDTFVKSASAPDANGVVPLHEADRQKRLADRVKTASILRLRVHQAGGAQMIRKSFLSGTKVSMTGAILMSYTLAKPDGTIVKADTFICGARIPAGKGLASPSEVEVQCNEPRGS
jgi:hypothetical protein